MSIGCFLTTVIIVDVIAQENSGVAKLEFRITSAIMIASEVDMAQVIVRNLEDAVKRKLKRRALRHGRSMEEEVRDILRDAVKDDTRRSGGFGTEAAKLFRGIGLTKPIQELRGYTIKPPKFD
jgi:antitoxin FitA